MSNFLDKETTFFESPLTLKSRLLILIAVVALIATYLFPLWNMMRVASLMTLNGTDIFGPGGAALLRFFGGERLSVTLLVTALSFWAIAPLVGAQKLLKHQDI